jgi:cysteinyl-tRNA synthetase
MCKALLGTHFDIHGGGIDLQFPHHENEIAQSEAANAGPFVNFWVHNGHLMFDDEKMSKSLGNFFTIRDVLQRYDGETLRFFLLRAHYRSPVNFTEANVDDARTALRRLYTALLDVEVPTAGAALDWSASAPAAFRAAMDDDFNTPQALAVLFDLAAQVNRSRDPARAAELRALGATLGLLQQAPRAYLQAGGTLDACAIAERIEARAAAKRARDFALADRIRRELSEQGVVLQDSPDGTTWRKA